MGTGNLALGWVDYLEVVVGYWFQITQQKYVVSKIIYYITRFK